MGRSRTAAVTALACAVLVGVGARRAGAQDQAGPTLRLDGRTWHVELQSLPQEVLPDGTVFVELAWLVDDAGRRRFAGTFAHWGRAVSYQPVKIERGRAPGHVTVRFSTLQMQTDEPDTVGERELDVDLDRGEGAGAIDPIPAYGWCDPKGPEGRPCRWIYLLGFSPAGRIAIVDSSSGQGYTPGGATGGRLRVLDLVKDAVLADVPFQGVAEQAAVLEQQGIRPAAPRHACGQADGLVELRRDLVLLRGPGGVRKRVGRVRLPESLERRPRTLTCLRSPFEPRLAILIEDISPDGEPVWRVMGGHLEAGYAARDPFSVAGVGEDLCTAPVAKLEGYWGARYGGCAADADGTARCFSRFDPARRLGGGPWAGIAFGDETDFGIHADGSLWRVHRAAAPWRIGSARWRLIVAGVEDAAIGRRSEHFCGIQEDGSLWCWGGNEVGQAGQPHSWRRDQVPTPTRVGAESDWVDLTAGGGFSCGIRAPGTLHCWGDGLGLYPARIVPGPQQVGAASDWTRVRAGEGHACGLRADRRLYCWGQYVPEGARRPAPLPTLVSEDEWRSVATGHKHTCGVKADGSLWCWGENVYGQLGRTVPPRDVEQPERVGTAAGWLDVFAGGDVTCGLRADGLWCWGANVGEQIGDPREDGSGVGSPTKLCLPP